MPTDSFDHHVSHRGADLDPTDQAVALFRYSVIADMTQLPSQHRGLYKLLAEKAEREYNIPGTLRRRVAAETIRGWLRAYRSGASMPWYPNSGPTSAVRARSRRTWSTCCASSKMTSRR